MKALRALLPLLLLLPAVGCLSEDEPISSESAASAPSAVTTRPNIIVIVTDDLNDEVFSHSTRIKSLLTDRGTKFRNNFVSLSLCCPARVATLRGQYAHNSGIFTNNAPDGGFRKVYDDALEDSTVATWLQAAGYRTALVGKYLNGYPNAGPSNTYIPPGWTRWFSPNGGSPYSGYDYSLNENGTTVSYGSAPADYLVDVIARKTTTFITNTVNNFPNKPFFIYVAPYVPHGPATPAPRHADRYPNARAPRTPSFNEADVSDKPAWVRSKAPLTGAQIDNLDEFYRKRLQSMLGVEDLVSDIIDTLAATGQLDNTYIFFTADNGFHQGQHRLNSGKNTAYDEDLSVPLVVRGPGVPAGQVVSSITANVDLAPTFAELAGVAAPGFVDGRSLVPFLTGTTPAVWRRALLLEHGGPSLTPASSDGLLEPQDAFDIQAAATGGAPVFAGIRTAVRTYVEYDNGERELYELQTDPHQLDNAYAAAEPALKARLSNWLGTLRHAAGATLRRAEEESP